MIGRQYAQHMDAAQALADLTEISSQVHQVAILDRDGSLLAATARDPARAERFVATLAPLLDEADRLARSRGLPELAQLEVSTLEGSVFAVRRDGRLIVATTRSDPTVGLIFYDLKHCLGSIDDAAAGQAQSEAEEAANGSGRAGRGDRAGGGGPTPLRKSLTLLMVVVGSLAGSVLYRRRSARRIERVELYCGRRLDGLATRRLDRGRADALARARRAVGSGLVAEAMVAAELAGAIREAALLEGDFVLRSGARSSYYLDKYRFSTRPDLLRRPRRGDRRARSPSTSPMPCASRRPSWARCRSPRQPRSTSGLPFVIVRNAVKDYGTGNRIEGVFEPGERVCLVEDVVTAGGAALEAVEALRDAGLSVSTVVCVVDREEGGADALARAAVRLRPLMLASTVRGASSTPHG